MRLLLLLIVAAVAAYYTKPSRDDFEFAAREALEAYAQAPPTGGLSADDVVAFVRGMAAGEGRYDDMFLAAKFTQDAPGSAFVECWGGYTMVQCNVVEPGTPG